MESAKFKCNAVYNGDFHWMLIVLGFLEWNSWIIKSVEFLTEQLNEIWNCPSHDRDFKLKNDRSSFQV